MRLVPLERDINIDVNGPLWVEVANPEHRFTAMLISRSRLEAPALLLKPDVSICILHLFEELKMFYHTIKMHWGLCARIGDRRPTLKLNAGVSPCGWQAGREREGVTNGAF